MSNAANHHLPPYLTVEGPNLAQDGHDLVRLAEQHGSPLFVFSGRRLAENARSMLAAARQGHPRARIFFASKACSNLHVLKVIRAQGLNIEVDSGGELWKALSAGFKPAEIVFKLDLTRLPAAATSPWSAAEVLANSSCRVRFWRLPHSMGKLARNADGDELLFVHTRRG